MLRAQPGMAIHCRAPSRTSWSATCVGHPALGSAVRRCSASLARSARDALRRRPAATRATTSPRSARRPSCRRSSTGPSTRRLAVDPALRHADVRVALLDLSHDGPPRLAQRHGEMPIYPASVVKFVYLMAAYAWQEQGQRRIDAELDDAAHAHDPREQQPGDAARCSRGSPEPSPGPELAPRAYAEFRGAAADRRRAGCARSASPTCTASTRPTTATAICTAATSSSSRDRSVAGGLPSPRRRVQQSQRHDRGRHGQAAGAARHRPRPVARRLAPPCASACGAIRASSRTCATASPAARRVCPASRSTRRAAPGGRSTPTPASSATPPGASSSLVVFTEAQPALPRRLHRRPDLPRRAATC